MRSPTPADIVAAMATLEAIASRAVLVAVLAFVSFAGCSSGKDRGIRGSGTIELNEIDVSSLVGGRVARLRVEEGDTVRSGDTLAVLAHGEVQAGVEAQQAEVERARALARDQALGPRAEERRTAQAQLKASEATLALAQNELERVGALYAKQLVAKSEFDRAQAARDEAAAKRDAAAHQLRLLEEGYRRQVIAAAREAAQAASAELRSARSKASELVLLAPADGVVLLKSVEQGEVIGAGVPIVTLGDPSKLWIRVYVPAPQVASIRLGDSASVHVLGRREEFPGRVVEIATRAEFTPRAALTEEERANIVFGVKVALSPTGGLLKPGLPADARIESRP